MRDLARPVFVDIDPVTFNLDGKSAAAAITARTKAIIPVHLFGRCAELDPILDAAREREVAVVEDAAQAIGAWDDQGRRAGSAGVMGGFSFFPSKNLGAFGDAGMVVTRNERLVELLRILRVHGSHPKYFHRLVGGNFRIALQAAILRVKLRYLEGWTAARRRNTDRYRALFREAGLEERIALPADAPGHICNQFIVRAPVRDRLRAFLREAGVETEVYYPVPLHLQECFRDLG